MKKIDCPGTPPDARRFYFLLLVSILLSSLVTAQPITGTVHDADNQAVAGATVMIKGTNKATITNGEGKFNIIAGKSAVLVFSSIGFVTQEVSLNGRTTLAVRMEPAAVDSLQNVIVIALGMRKPARR